MQDSQNKTYIIMYTEVNGVKHPHTLIIAVLFTMSVYIILMRHEAYLPAESACYGLSVCQSLNCWYTLSNTSVAVLFY